MANDTDPLQIHEYSHGSAVNILINLRIKRSKSEGPKINVRNENCFLITQNSRRSNWGWAGT